MVEQRRLRQVTHGTRVLLDQKLQDTPVLDRHAFTAKFFIELLVHLPGRARQKISNVLVNRAIAGHGHCSFGRIRFHGPFLAASILRGG
jgi:hypothetical protein